jgi:exonuclease III
MAGFLWCPLFLLLAMVSGKTRVVQYNVEWLFIDYYAPADCPGSGCSWHTDSDARDHLSHVSEILTDLQPDILNVCEVEGSKELEMLNDELGGQYDTWFVQGTDTSTGQNVGMLTTIPLTANLTRSVETMDYPLPDTRCGADDDMRGSTGVSKHYISEFTLGSTRVALIAAHLLAKPTDPGRCVKREAQAQVLQHIVREYIGRGSEVLLLGDFNDYDGDIPDINNHQPISRVLDILKGHDDDDPNAPYRLISAAQRISSENRYTNWWDSDSNCGTQSAEDYAMIDHALMTPGLYNFLENVFVYQAYDEYCGKIDSDHYPLVLDFEMG